MSVVIGNALPRALRLALCTLAVAAGAAASLSSPLSAQGSEEERRACTPDVFRLCSSEIPNVDRIVACLNKDRARLSPACRAVMAGDARQGKTRAARADR